MEYQNITNLLGNMPDKVPNFITKKWIEVHDQSGNANYRYKPNKQIRLKTSMLQSDLCDYSDACIVTKGKITVTGANDNAYDKKLAFKIMHHLLSVFQKLIIHFWKMQRFRHCNANI